MESERRARWEGRGSPALRGGSCMQRVREETGVNWEGGEEEVEVEVEVEVGGSALG
jgi:hypothetical protein